MPKGHHKVQTQNCKPTVYGRRQAWPSSPWQSGGVVTSSTGSLGLHEDSMTDCGCKHWRKPEVLERISADTCRLTGAMGVPNILLGDTKSHGGLHLLAHACSLQAQGDGQASGNLEKVLRPTGRTYSSTRVIKTPKVATKS